MPNAVHQNQLQYIVLDATCCSCSIICGRTSAMKCLYFSWLHDSRASDRVRGWMSSWCILSRAVTFSHQQFNFQINFSIFILLPIALLCHSSCNRSWKHPPTHHSHICVSSDGPLSHRHIVQLNTIVYICITIEIINRWLIEYRVNWINI